MTREYTNKLLEAMAEGVLSAESIVEMCLCYMSEDDVKDMVVSNDMEVLIGAEDPDDEFDVDEATEWRDFDPEC